MSEGAGAEATSSETSGSVAAAAAATAAPAADPLAAGEAFDELLAANDDHESSKKRKYPEPGFAVERSGPAGRNETRWLKTLFSRIPLTPFLLAGRQNGIGVWYTKLAVVVGGRMRVWFWRVATGHFFVYLP